MGFDDDERHRNICIWTSGRTMSTAELTFNEARELLAKLSDTATPNNLYKERLNVIKRIYKLSFEITFLNKDFDSSTKEDVEMNKAKISVWTKKQKWHKAVIDMNMEELKEVERMMYKVIRKDN